MSELPADHRLPLPPVRPSQDDCCKGSCDPCVFDLYEQAVERYRADLSAWQKRKSAERKSALDRAAPDESA
ncbi:MAG TPA: oxidoreductase-like domain-containing protein [Casimicrobiaceae bacterium]|nr:oxidoreductase-like domain-containing protein [Casimicrobiaceae bacterium]